ncbi:TonB-dependent receptor [Poritiphilus flavus]|nr:TonB-dependent receptor [Poritiphilus flavus]
MLPKAIRFSLVLLLSLQFLPLKAQNSIEVGYENLFLKEVLADIEEKSGLSFSYSDELIANKRVTIKPSDLSLDSILNILADDTGLLFEKIGDRQVIISVPKTETLVCGYLFDGLTKAPLPYATLILKGTAKGYTTDENGYFAIDDESTINGILVQYVGYAERLLLPADFTRNDCGNILLYPQAETLNEVIVRSYLIRGIDKNKDGSLTLSSEEQGILPGLVEPDIFQSAQWVPGITSINETVSDIQIRGGSADQNLILYDGIKMYNTGHFFGMLSIFNPNITSNATIFKGGASPEYGDRISGVIDIQGETGVPEKTRAGLGINGTQADAFVKARLGESVGLVVSGRRSYADVGDLGTPTFDAISEKVFQNTIVVNEASGQIIEDEDEETLVGGEETFFFYDTNIKLIIQPSEKDSIYLSGLLTNNDLNFRLQEDENLTEDALITENEGLSFEWIGEKGTNWHYSFGAYYSDYESFYRTQFREQQQIEEDNLRRNTVLDYGFNAELAYDFSRQHAIKGGYQYSSNEVFYQLSRDENGDDGEPEDDEDPLPSADERDFNEVSNRKNTTNTVYGAYVFRPQNKGLISLGLRVSTFSLLDGWYFEPRLNVEYPLSKLLRLKLTGEKRYQTISQLVEFDDTRLRLQSGIWTLTDDNEFPLLESEQFSLGLLFDFKGWILDVDGYVKKIDGLTTFTNGFTNASENYSQGTSDVFGLDFLLKKQLGNYRIWLGYTYNKVDYRFEELQDAKFPGNNDITNNLTFSNTYEAGNWRFSLGWNYRTGVPFTPVSGFNVVTGDIEFETINSGRLPDYHRLDASLQYGFRLSSKNESTGTIGLSLQNVYNRQVPLSVFYRVDENPLTGLQDIDQLEQLSLGLTPNFLLRFNF